jgi:hypothetical protein
MSPHEILLIRCNTLEKRIADIENAETEAEKTRLAVVASTLAVRILEMTPEDALDENIQKYLDHFSFAVFSNNMVWARETIEKLRTLIRNRDVLF